MSSSDVRPTLRIILHADVVDSTALVRVDERIAHVRIQDAFRRFADSIAAYGGTTRELRGDALLADFERASDAIAAALAFQAGNARHNAALEDAIRPELRTGISLGEVVLADATLTGPDVVLAQRLEQLAPPGGVCVSQAVRQATPQRHPFAFDDLGEQQLKGFDEPVRAFCVALESGAELPTPHVPHAAPANEGASSMRRAARPALALAVVLGVAAWLWWATPGQAPPAPVATAPAPETDSAAAAPEAAGTQQPDAPSIAVLPFTNMSADPQQEYFADGMTDDLITDLSKLSGLTVIARTSTFMYKGRAGDIREIGQALSARYVVEGSVRRADDAVRINAQLIDTTTGHHVWAERYDGKLKDVFALQDRITRQVVEALALKLNEAENEALARAEAVDLEAYELFLQGSSAFQRFSRADTFIARRLFERAIELEPKFARAYAMLAWTHVFEYSNGWSADAQASLDKALELATTSIGISASYPIAYFVKGLVHRERDEFEAALEAAQAAIRIEPSYANAHILLATLLYYAGRAQEGLALVDKASRLNPHHPSNYPFHRGQALFILGRYDEAIDAFREGLKQNPTSQRLRVWLAATYAELGREDDAKWEAAEILDADPTFSADELIGVFPFQNSDDLDRFNRALRKAGFAALRRSTG